MDKAFIFDMDGVLVDSERAWEDDEYALLEDLFGKDILAKTGRTFVGGCIRTTYERARALGLTLPYEEYVRRYDEAAHKVLARAHITPGLDRLGARLKELGYALGLVSSSRLNWIEQVLSQLPFREELRTVISLHDTPGLRTKPSPDGYIEAFKRMNARPERSMILEDSNPGIAAGKASGAYVIGFRANLLADYKQEGADAYADTMEEVAGIVERFTRP